MSKNFDIGLFERIDKLFDVSSLKDTKVLIVGCGSGGGNVALQLVMSGINKFTLIDNDSIGYENVIRHVCGIRYIGRKKVDALEEILFDRNPNIEVKKFDANVLEMDSATLKEEIKTATVVVLATDNDTSRYFINQICVEHGVPFVTARVFTRGIGGEVFAYRPKDGGCLACLENRLERTQFRTGIKEIDLVSEEEKEKMYGMEIPEIKDSPGLNVDIAFITAFHTRLVLDTIANELPNRPKFMIPLEHNYYIWGNRPISPFTKNFELQRLKLNKQLDCQVCSIINKND
jgi:molybdopterin/thiamine biosynthesis adenylyltransferase